MTPLLDNRVSLRCSRCAVAGFRSSLYLTPWRYRLHCVLVRWRLKKPRGRPVIEKILVKDEGLREDLGL